MKRTILSLALAALLAPSAPAQDPSTAEADSNSAEVMMLRLYDGTILWGGIEGHDAEMVHFRRLDNGGLARLPWSRLDPSQADQLLEEFGYVDNSSEEIMTEADRLILIDGREIIGKIVNRTETEIWVKTSNSTVPVPKMRLRTAATVVQVPALDVYTREELYQQEVSRLVPDSAKSHLDLAVFCERIFDFDNAIAHVEAARKLDSELDSAELDIVVNRLDEKRQNYEQIEALREIDLLRARGKYDEALARAESFPELFPDSPLRTDAARKKALVERSRENALRDRVVRSWHLWARRLTRRAALDPDQTLESVLGWIDEGLGEEIVTSVHADLSRAVSAAITPDEVRKYWTERDGGRWQKASYGQGTWLLGEADAHKGREEAEDPNTSKGSERDEERKKLEERIKRYMKNQEMVRKAKASVAGGGDEDDQQSFWETWSSTGRAQWILAYYAENSGDMEVRDPPYFRNCPQCGGTGVREVISTGSARTGSTGSNTNMIPCPTCHHIGILRKIAYR